MRIRYHHAWHPPPVFQNVKNMAAASFTFSKSQANFSCGQVHCNSDINYLELGQTSQVKGLMLHKTALTSGTSSNLVDCRSCTLLTNWLEILGFPPLLSFNNLLKWLTELRKQLCLWLLWQRDTKQNQIKEETNREGSGMVSNGMLPCPLPVESGYIILLVHQCILLARRLI